MIKRLCFKQLNIITVFLLLGTTVSCGAPMTMSGVPGVAQVDVLSVVSTDKTMFDHLVSYTSGKDCSAVRVEKGKRYCKEDEPIIKPQVYCYSTLGRANCYEMPDPYANGQRETGNNDHNHVKIKKSQASRF
ncbi:MAG: hypothetical protein CMF69_06925 [Magnetovibrio sp.]|nr:hypothetical protein [Magnetovibrio sp.]|tara:strand:- start:602 stop:997 length:396 start_codon:yes stop_codon:yes gene_type:complete